MSDELRVAELGGASGWPLARAKAATFAWSWKSCCGFLFPLFEVENPWKIMAKTMENQGKSGKIRENQGKSGKTEWVDGKIYWIYMSLAMKYIGFSCKIVPQKNDPVKNVPWNPKSAAGLYQQKHEAQTLTGKMHMFNSKNDKEVHWTSKTGDVIPKIACYTDKHVGFNQQKLSLSEEKHLQIPVVHVGVPFPCFITRGLLQQ